MNPKHRGRSGNMLVLIAVIAMFVFVPILIFLCRFSPFVIGSERSQNVVEAAGLLAANELSKIVMYDPDFGYVGLSNYPATGKFTPAKDGQPLPVIGVNTLVGTLRQTAVIANQLHCDRMNTLLDQDLASLKGTINNLNNKIAQVLSDDSPRGCIDVDGVLVQPLQHVRTFLEQNLPPNTNIESLTLSPGWLEGGSETGIVVPKPEALSMVHPADMDAGQYEAFRNIPVGGKPFQFAGLGVQAHLVSNRKFREPDGHHINTIVKIECVLSQKSDPSTKINCVACCQPAARPDTTRGGAMTVRFSGRPVPGLLSWNDFLMEGSFQDNKVTVYDVVNGDYPYQHDARVYPRHLENTNYTSQQFAENLYCWLRNGHCKPRVDAVMAMMNEPFLSCLNEVYSYEFSDDGSIQRKVYDGRNFTRAVTADGQFNAVADTRVKSGAYAIVIFRDNVRRLGSSGGKHAGQPLAGYPLENSDAAYDYEQLAAKFANRAGSPSGLALDIEIGGTSDSTARRDVLSMREKTKSRRI